MVGRNVKRLVDALEELRQIGLKAIDTQLPELVLVGDQSSGKSSLMSAIAGINLPKGEGTCTRCPTNIQTSQAPTWICEVSLKESYSHTPNRRAKPFPYWMENEGPITTTHFARIEDKTRLEEVLRWAQVALLTPSRNPLEFVPGTQSQIREAHLRNENPDFHESVLYSPNVIHIAISGPGLPALSFYDLPGIYRNYQKDDEQYLVDVFIAMTVKYIQHERALIVCAMAMKNDPGLSNTNAIINMYNKQHGTNKRCLGVLTMPDRMEFHETKVGEYEKLLHGKGYHLGHGYLVTKQPGADFREPNSSPHYHEIARQEENEFFTTNLLWREGGRYAQFQNRCGTATIQDYLSKTFAKLIFARFVS
jgi:GTPase SAR1 family protein